MAEAITELELRYAVMEGTAFLEWRAKYNQADRDKMAKSGSAMPDGSYPISDAEDLSNAIHAVGRGGASHNAIRAHIIARAKALGLSSQIPDNWASDGSLKEQNAASQECDVCDGTGKIRGGSRTCPKCGGSGKLPDDDEQPGNTDDQNDDEETSATLSFEQRKAKVALLENHMERRFFSASECRMESDGESLRFSGYASLTETPYPVGFYTETIRRGAFKRTLGSNPDVQMLINHGEGGSGMPIARTGVNMTLAEDERGLRVDAELDPQDPDVQLLARKMDRGLINQMSFAFQVDGAAGQEWNEDYTQRTIKSLSIHRGDVSVVNMGASPTTSASIE